MERSNLPLSFYLNNGEPDKTGFKKLARSAFYKAVAFHPETNRVTLGPNAETSNESSEPNQTQEQKDTVDDEPKVLKLLRNKLRALEEQQRQRETQERLLRKKILSSLENICLAESQEKVEKMRREWERRQRATLLRLQTELDETVRSLKQEMLQERQKRREEALKAIEEELPSSALDEVEEADLLKNTLGSLRDHSISLKPSSTPKPVVSSVPAHPSYYESEIMKFYKDKFSSVALGMQNSQLPPVPEDSTASDSEDAGPSVPEPVLPPSDLTESVPIIEAVISLQDLEKNAEEIGEDTAKELTENKIDEEKTQVPYVAIKQDVPKDDTFMEEDMFVDEAIPQSPAKEIDPQLERVMIVMEHYKKYLKVLNETKASLKTFMSDDSLKKFRSECQKAVNVPVNAISGVSSAHLMDKLMKLSTLLSGGQVIVNNKEFNPSQHPLATTYCTYLLAQKIVRQGEDAVSVKSESAFPIALLVLELWDQFPLFGSLLMAVFHEVCPYLVPIYWVKEEKMTDEEYHRKLGFKYSSEGEQEEIDMFLKRQGGVVRLYFSIVVSHMRGRGRSHPLPLTEAWRWIAIFTSLDPSPEITATLLYDMLEITGHSLLKYYRKQFMKLVHVICKQFVPEIQAVTPPGKGGPVSRLNSFFEELVQKQDIKPPKGILPLNFW